MSAGEQRTAIDLLLAAVGALTDPLTSDAERRELAERIGRFLRHEPVEAAAPTTLDLSAGKKGGPL